MLRAEIDQLLICDPEKSRAVSHVFIGHPTPLEEKSLGKIFGIATIQGTEPMNATILQAVQETLLDRYYHTDDFTLEIAFEHAVQAVNERLNAFVREGITNWVERLDILLGVQKGESLLFARAGRILAYLIHHGRIIDIVGQTSPPEEPINPLRVFSHVVAGRVSADDHVLFCTTSLLDYLSVEKLRRLMTIGFPRDTVMQLSELLREDMGRTAFGALIIKVVPADAPGPQPAQLSTGLRMAPTFPGPQGSMEQLIRKEQATAELLEPSVWPSLWRGLTSAARMVTNLVRTTILHKPPLRARPAPAHRLYTRDRRRAAPERLLRFLLTATRALGALLLQGGTALMRLVRRPRAVADRISAAPDRATTAALGFTARFARLSRNQKVLLLAAVGFLFFFSWSIVSRGRGDQSASDANVRAATVETIRSKVHDAEAFLSFGNDDGAQALLREAEALVRELPSRRKADKDTVRALTAAIEDAKEKARHRTILASPTEKATLPVGSDEAVAGLLLAQGALVGYTPKGNLAFFDLEEESAKLVAQTVPDLSRVTLAIPPTTATILLYDAERGLIEHTLATGQSKLIQTTFANLDRGFEGIAAFESRVYFLDAKNNQIFRHVRIAGGYGPATPWVKEADVPFGNAVDLVVDGSVYVLRADGTVQEFFQGRPTDFALAPIDPPLASGTRLWTSPTAQGLYILDPAGKRLVVFDKKGKLLDQYQAEAFGGAKDFAIDAKNKRAYVLVEAKVYEVPLNR